MFTPKKERKGISRSPSPSYMDSKQFAAYLADLRNNRINRPGGARPQPGSTTSRDSARLSVGGGGGARASLDVTPTPTPPPEATAAPAHHQHQHQHQYQHQHERSASDLPAAAKSATIGNGRPSLCASVSSRHSAATLGRDYYQPEQAQAQPQARPPPRPNEVLPSGRYMERGQRWMEKEEAVSLRHAMEDMDLKVRAQSIDGPEERRLYEAALDEAAELVWQHQNQNRSPAKSPEPGAPYRYRPHLRKNSYAHARAASAGLYGDDVAPTGLARDPAARSVSGSSNDSDGLGSLRSRASMASSRRTSGFAETGRDSLESRKSYGGGGIGGGPQPAAVSSHSGNGSHRRRSSLRRNISGEVQKPFSGDQIWEEPEGSGQTPERRKGKEVAGADSSTASAEAEAEAEAAVHALRIKPRNPLNRAQFAPDLPEDADVDTSGGAAVAGLDSSSVSVSVSVSVTPPPKQPVSAPVLSKYEIHRNPPSQSRNPQYTTNPNPNPRSSSTEPAAAAAAAAAAANSSGSPTPSPVPRKHGLEIRGEDIRQATSMRLRDRSAKLPTPSAVSDNPDRPIVSFSKDWKPPEEATDEKPDARQQHHHHHHDRYGRGGSGSGSGNGGRGVGSGGDSDYSQDPFVSSSPQGRVFRAEHPQRHQHQQVQVPAVAVTAAPPTSSSLPATPPRRSQPQPQPQPPPPPPPVAVPVNSNPSIPTIPASDSGSSGHGPRPSSIPTIAVSDATTAAHAIPIPSIVVPDGGPDEDEADDMFSTIPTIVIPPSDNDTSTSASASSRPLPSPHQSGANTHARRRSHWSPAPTVPIPSTSSRATARCHECGHAIEGRFVSLSGSNERFHPGCFRCYTCGTSLEALEISPEPDAHRAARLARIAARARGEMLPETPGETMAEDGDASGRLRFYCHLDWHEQFAPRCKHCGTPIIGEHVVALGGAHWHYGHFFCAECGDPFGPGATHIEKDGYAWCVSCQTRRTERRAPKCRRCRLPVVGQYVRALGGEWHDACFRCARCGGGFDDGQIFPVEGRGTQPGETVVLCTGCRERELKA